MGYFLSGLGYKGSFLSYLYIFFLCLRFNLRGFFPRLPNSFYKLPRLAPKVPKLFPKLLKPFRNLHALFSRVHRLYL